MDPATGNRTGTASTTTSAVTTASYNYPTATSLHPHAVSSVTTTAGAGSPSTASYGYNAEGDTTTRPGETLTYDPEGHLATVTDGGNTQSNTYDADGSLLLQKDGNNYTLYLGATELHKDGSGPVYAIRTYSLGGTAVAERTTCPTGRNILRWLAGDNHNTATLEVVASTGATTARYQDPYGNPRGTNPSWSSGHTFLNDDHAAVSGTVVVGARTYDSIIGRFLTVDGVLAPLNPLQNSGYAYSANNPVGGSDPSGECFLNEDGGCYLSGAAADHAAASRPSAKPFVQVSPHVFVSSGDPAVVSQAEKAYSGAREEYGFEPGDKFSSESQEMDLWFQYCLSNECPDELKVALMSAMAFAPTDKGLALQEMITAGTATFYVGSGPDIGYSPISYQGATSVDVRSPDFRETMDAVPESELDSMPDIDKAKFAQTSYSEQFKDEGSAFKGMSIDDLAKAVKGGWVPVSDVPIGVIVRGGSTLILNTRSAIALQRAGVPRSQWNVVNQTGDPGAEGRLTEQLARNGLSSEGTDIGE